MLRHYINLSNRAIEQILSLSCRDQIIFHLEFSYRWSANSQYRLIENANQIVVVLQLDAIYGYHGQLSERQQQQYKEAEQGGTNCYRDQLSWLLQYKLSHYFQIQKKIKAWQYDAEELKHLLANQLGISELTENIPISATLSYDVSTLKRLLSDYLKATVKLTWRNQKIQQENQTGWRFGQNLLGNYYKPQLIISLKIHDFKLVKCLLFSLRENQLLHKLIQHMLPADLSYRVNLEFAIQKSETTKTVTRECSDLNQVLALGNAFCY